MALKEQPIDLLLDANRNVVLVNGDIVWSTGIDAVAQAIDLAVSTHMGEVFYNLTEGIPYFERDGVDAARAILGQRFDAQKTCAEFARVIRSVDDVEDIEQLSATFDTKTRTLRVSWTVITVWDNTETIKGELTLTR